MTATNRTDRRQIDTERRELYRSANHEREPLYVAISRERDPQVILIRRRNGSAYELPSTWWKAAQ